MYLYNNAIYLFTFAPYIKSMYLLINITFIYSYLFCTRIWFIKLLFDVFIIIKPIGSFIDIFLIKCTYLLNIDHVYICIYTLNNLLLFRCIY